MFLVGDLIVLNPKCEEHVYENTGFELSIPYVIIEQNGSTILIGSRDRFRVMNISVHDVLPYKKKHDSVECECGAKYTTNKLYHLRYCPLNKGE